MPWHATETLMAYEPVLHYPILFLSKSIINLFFQYSQFFKVLTCMVELNMPPIYII
jgi:hypothetical protein